MRLNRFSLLVSACCVVLGMFACTTVPETKPPLKPAEILRASTFEAVSGWAQDDLREAWPAFMASCDVLVRKADWKEVCTLARNVNVANDGAARRFFETYFTPHQIVNTDSSEQGLITGYYEPLLRGARTRGGPFQTPLYRVPENLLIVDMVSLYPELKGMRLRGRLVGNKVVPYYSRAELEKSGALEGKELLWVDNPIEAFFLEVQGSGRVQLADSNETVRVAYADQNGHPYKSIGRYLVDKGEMPLSQASMQGIKAWIAANPGRQQELLNANPSYVFFKEEKLADPQMGPKGALGVPLTARRSIAVDARYLPLGAPVFLATTQPLSDVPLQRLVMAQDTGGAIRGALRADFFWGFGSDAAANAGRMKQSGRMWVLLPKTMVVSPTMRW
ncbi:MAG: murein transglycosylase A [Burkholderiales bacterium]|nr:murein transglycosylase A [Burkholderiales bacterium]